MDKIQELTSLLASMSSQYNRLLIDLESKNMIEPEKDEERKKLTQAHFKAIAPVRQKLLEAHRKENVWDVTNLA